MSENTNTERAVKPSGISKREYELIQELVKAQLERNEELEYESFDGYELPPRTQFSMLKKPAVSIKDGKMTFNMAAIRLFEGVQYVLPMINRETKRMAIVPCAEEESASVEWARIRKKDEAWVNKTISSRDFIQNIYDIMGWTNLNRYKVLGRVANSERGLILVFELEEAITFEPRKETYVDEKTGQTKTRPVKNYPEKYNGRIGQTYDEYKQHYQQEKYEEVDKYTENPANIQDMTGNGTVEEDIRSTEDGVLETVDIASMTVIGSAQPETAGIIASSSQGQSAENTVSALQKILKDDRLLKIGTAAQEKEIIL